MARVISEAITKIRRGLIYRNHAAVLRLFSVPRDLQYRLHMTRRISPSCLTMTGDSRKINTQRIIRFREASVEAKPCRMAGNLRKMHSPSDASIRNSSARIYIDTYIRTMVICT